MNMSLNICKQLPLLILLLAISEIGKCTDLGKYGQLFKIEEEPFQQMLKSRMDKFDLAKEQEKITTRVKESIENPPALNDIEQAEESRIYYIDPSYVVKKDIVLPCGKIAYKAGHKVNPLDHMDLNRRMIFIDGRNQKQLDWLKELLEHSKNKSKTEETFKIEDRVILIGGSVFKVKEELGEDHEHKVYFDQLGELTKRFGVKASPAVLIQEGKRLKIEEIISEYLRNEATDQQTGL